MDKVKLQSSIAITVFREMNLKKEDIITGKRGDGSEVLRTVKPNWHKKSNSIDLKKGVGIYPHWILEIGMIKTLIKQEKVTVVGNVPKTKAEKDAEKLATKEAKEVTKKAKDEADKPKVKTKAAKAKLPE